MVFLYPTGLTSASHPVYDTYYLCRIVLPNNGVRAWTTFDEYAKTTSPLFGVGQPVYFTILKT